MMTRAYYWAGLAAVLAAACAGAASRQAEGQVAAQKQILQLFSASPAVFIENTGQIDDPSVRYVFKGSGANIYHTTQGVVFQLFKKEKTATEIVSHRENPEKQLDRLQFIGDHRENRKEETEVADEKQNGPDGFRRDWPGREKNQEDWQTKSYAFSATFVGAANIEPAGEDLQQTKVNYYMGNDPNKWRRNVHTYGKVTYPNLYDGIDLHTFGRRSHLKYEFHVAPGADYSQIEVRYEGIDGLSIDNEGKLHIRTPLGEIIDDAPLIYQLVAGRKTEVPGQYCLLDKTTYTFELKGRIDPFAELVIDPDLAWASFLGGTGEDYGWDIAVDANGDALLTGWAESTDFPTPNGFDLNYNGGDHDAFVAKVSSSGQLCWASYLGGSSNDEGRVIAVDSGGDALLTGLTRSTDFPLPGGFDKSLGGYRDGFVAKVSGSGQLIWASFLGGSGDDYGFGIAVDSSGNALLTGHTSSTDFPTPNGFDPNYNGSYDAFVAKVTGDGSQLIWASFLGGRDRDWGWRIAVDSAGDALLTGDTESTDFPVPGGFDTSLGGERDAFAAKVSGDGSRLIWASYLGGSGSEYGEAIAVDSGGDALLTGGTDSTDFPASGGFDTTHNGYYDVFVAKASSSGQLLWASYLGGSSDDVGRAIAVDSAGNALLTGQTKSTDFPLPGGFDTSHNGNRDVFVAKASSSGQLLWASYLGGSSDDVGRAIAVDSAGDALLTGETNSTDFPVPGGFDTSYNGSADVFVAKISIPIPVLRVVVDIKPGSCPNPLNVKSKGVLPVAVLGSDDFDVYDIDVASIRLAGVAPIRSSFEDVATPVVDGNECECTEEGPDGYLDLTLKFKTQEIVAALGDVNDGDILPLTLEGALFDQTPIEGADCIVVRGKAKSPHRADINSDGFVDLSDFAEFAADWLESNTPED